VPRISLRLALPTLAACALAAALLLVACRSGDSAAAPPKKPDVILLVFDEFLGDALLDRDGRIDAVRYPNLAALADDANWFPNAFSSYDSTSKGTPLILDGIRPVLHNPPTRRGHRRSIYDLFGRRGYRFVNSEAATALCPRRYCRNARRRPPKILPQLARGRPQRFARFVRRVRPRAKPTFYFQHVLLPHVPYNYLPSGRRAREGGGDLVRGMNGPLGFHDRFLMQHNYQRYLLQQGFVDHLLGKLLRRLREQGMYEDTMIVITADQAMAVSEVGTKDRRKVNSRNVDEVASIPMLIKQAGQKEGRTHRTYMRTLGVTPTIADLLNFRLPYRADGRSAFSRAVKRRRSVFLVTRFFERIVRISARRYEARRDRNVARRLRWFGAGSESMFAGIGPNRELVGRRVADLRVGAASEVRGSVTGAARLRDVDPASGLIPTQIVGDLAGGRRGEKRAVAVAVNGRIQAVGRTWYLKGSRTEHFAVNVPESAIRAGRNRIEVFEVDRNGGLHLLARV